MSALKLIAERMPSVPMPPEVAADPRRSARWRLAALMGASTMFWGPVFLVVYGLLGQYLASAVVGAAAVYLATAPWVLRWSASEELAGHHCASALWFAIVGLTLLTGGLHATPPPWLVACPVLAAGVGGWRPGLIWLGVSLASYVALGTADLAGAPLPPMPVQDAWILRMSSLTGAVVFVYSLVAFFQYEADALARRLEAQVAQLSDANHAKSLFLANMSHELRTPMNAILGYTELVDEELEDRQEPELRDDLSRVMGASRHLLALIDDLLDLSRIEVGALTFDLDEHQLDQVCRDVVASLVPMAERSGTEVGVQLNAVRCRCDRLRAAQIVTNLVHNAVKFDSGGSVTVRCFAVDGVAVVEVHDTGPGLSDVELAQVFDEFQQAHPAIRAKHGGTGLGLSISRRLARAMGGDVGATSTPGEGSVFRVELPLVTS